MTSPIGDLSFTLSSADRPARRQLEIRGATQAALRPDGDPRVLIWDIEASGACTLEWWCHTPAAVTVWRPLHSSARDLPPDWHPHSQADARTTKSAPVASLVDAAGQSRLTFSLSASVRASHITVGVDEEHGEQHCVVRVTDIAATEGKRQFQLRLDLRPQHFSDALRDVAAGWQSELEAVAVPVPDLAHRAMYSTWYSEHQGISAAAVERHAAAALGLGCEAIIVDGGWQNNDTAIDQNEGLASAYYASCGDWQPDLSRFPDMSAHVRKVHALGLRYLLWVAPPFVGDRSSVWDQFKDKTLGRRPQDRFAVLDPRYPEVRAHIVEVCTRPVREWGVDGLKIDFVDQWARFDEAPGAGADCASVDEGAERVLAAITAEVRRTRPDALIEFRQDYVHPRLWPFGTLVRANDCPADAVENRVRTIDLRLIAGDRAVHSDMLMWHRDASAEEVASQFIGALFSTLQVSTDLERASAAHRDVVHFWLTFAREHSDTLLRARLQPERPDARYTQVRAVAESESIVVAYADPLVEVGDPSLPLTVVNGTGASRIVLDSDRGGSQTFTVRDSAGRILREWTQELSGLLAVSVPPSGLIQLSPTAPSHPGAAVAAPASQRRKIQP